MFNNKTILITGGTGSFGKKFLQIILRRFKPKKVIIFSRDELKQFEMAQRFSKDNERIRYFIGDVRDFRRLERAFSGVDYVIHAAALKQVPAMEYNPSEAVKTNVIGAMNVIDAAINSGVKQVIALSTDKACNPTNLYGATKLCSDKLFVSANSYSGRKGTKFSVVRYGNVAGSRGSVVPLFKSLLNQGPLPVTDSRMTRFWITLDHGVNFVIQCFKLMKGGEIFVPKLPSVNIMDLVKALDPRHKVKYVGIRPGEKLHELLISIHDAHTTVELSNCYIIQPAFPWWRELNNERHRKVAPHFSYASNTNKKWLSLTQLKRTIKTLEEEV